MDKYKICKELCSWNVTIPSILKLLNLIDEDIGKIYKKQMYTIHETFQSNNYKKEHLVFLNELYTLITKNKKQIIQYINAELDSPFSCRKDILNFIHLEPDNKL